MSSAASFTLDTTAFNRAMREFASVTKRGLVSVGMYAAKGFVKRAVAVTPPATGSLVGAKQKGESTIRGDMARIFWVISASERQSFIDFHGGYSAKEGFGHAGAAALGDIEKRILSLADMEAWHHDRRKANGRVKGVRGGRQLGNLHAAYLMTTGLRKCDLRALDVGLVLKKDRDAYRKKLFGRIGLLASGWNAAAIKLGLALPDWIGRQGQGRGICSVTIASGGVTIEMANKVPFVGNVRGLDSRCQAALKYQEGAMMRQIEHLLEKARRKAFG